MEIIPCKCGKLPRFWRFGDVYICGCINSNCHEYPARSLRSKEDAIRRWNKKMKGELNNDQN